MDQAELDTLDERIRQAKAAIAERASIAARRPAIHAEHAEAAGICKHTAARVDKERADIDKARDGGVWSFLRGVVGDRDARVGKEIEEARAAEARHTEAVAYRDRLAAELAKLDDRIKALASAEAELDDARRAKQFLLVELDAQRGAELTRIAEQIADVSATRSEIDEALAAGDGALSALIAMEGALRAAREWGIADMGSGSLMADEMKRDAAATAQGLVGTVQAELMLYQRELADVGRTLNIALPDLEVGRAVWDVWFDSLLFGAMPVQQRVIMAHAVIEDAVVRMREQLLELRVQRTTLTSKVDALARQRTAVLDPARG